NTLIHHRPTDELQAKFSMEFCMAALLLYRKAGLSEFNDEVVNRPAVKQMIARVKFGVDPVAEAAGYNKMTTILKLHLKDGRVGTLADAGFLPYRKCRDESRHGTQECVRYFGGLNRSSISFIFSPSRFNFRDRPWISDSARRFTSKSSSPRSRSLVSCRFWLII